jgi:hypothetical protein
MLVAARFQKMMRRFSPSTNAPSVAPARIVMRSSPRLGAAVNPLASWAGAEGSAE